MMYNVIFFSAVTATTATASASNDMSCPNYVPRRGQYCSQRGVICEYSYSDGRDISYACNEDNEFQRLYSGQCAEFNGRVVNNGYIQDDHGFLQQCLNGEWTQPSGSCNTVYDCQPGYFCKDQHCWQIVSNEALGGDPFNSPSRTQNRLLGATHDSKTKHHDSVTCRHDQCAIRTEHGYKACVDEGWRVSEKYTFPKPTHGCPNGQVQCEVQQAAMWICEGEMAATAPKAQKLGASAPSPKKASDVSCRYNQCALWAEYQGGWTKACVSEGSVVDSDYTWPSPKTCPNGNARCANEEYGAMWCCEGETC